MEITLQQLEAHLWGAANILRGKAAGQDYKNILSLMFYQRLCDQWECEADDAIAELEGQQGRAFSEKEKAVFRKRREHRFKIPEGSRWGDAKAGEFFTPPEVVETLVRILEPRPGDAVYDPTSGSGGMLVHTADYLREHGHHATCARCCAAAEDLRRYSVRRPVRSRLALPGEPEGGCR